MPDLISPPDQADNVVVMGSYLILKLSLFWLTIWISLILNEHVIVLTEKTEKIGCIISIPSIYNIVVIDNFDFNYFQIDLDFGNFGIFLRAHKAILIKRLLYISR